MARNMHKMIFSVLKIIFFLWQKPWIYGLFSHCSRYFFDFSKIFSKTLELFKKSSRLNKRNKQSTKKTTQKTKHTFFD